MSNDSDQTNTNSDQTIPDGQPVRTMPDRPPVRSQAVQTAEQPVDVRRTVVVETERKESNLGEYVKFIILALILLGTPVVIALLSPLIFGQIVPAVMGANLPPDPPVVIPADQVVEPETTGTPGPVLPTDPQTGIGGEATPAAYPAAPQPTPTADTRYHVVQPGETLEAIARQYGLTSAQLAAANNIQNPNRIQSGTILIIPPPATQ